MRPLLLLAVCSLALVAADVRVSATADGSAEITLANGKSVRAPKEKGQVGIEPGDTAEDGKTVGWLVLYDNPAISYPYPGTLVIWRDGKILRRFETEQSFYSWAYVNGGTQVAYHTGPLHGEQASHCELHDIMTGKLLASWEGDLESDARPEWTRGLNH